MSVSRHDESAKTLGNQACDIGFQSPHFTHVDPCISAIYQDDLRQLGCKFTIKSPSASPAPNSSKFAVQIGESAVISTVIVDSLKSDYPCRKYFLCRSRPEDSLSESYRQEPLYSPHYPSAPFFLNSTTLEHLCQRESTKLIGCTIKDRLSLMTGVEQSVVFTIVGWPECRSPARVSPQSHWSGFVSLVLKLIWSSHWRLPVRRYACLSCPPNWFGNCDVDTCPTSWGDESYISRNADSRKLF